MAFHVPERARDTVHPQLRTSTADGNNGVFDVASSEPGWQLVLICSDGEGWEHVSVHAWRGPDRTSTKTKRRTPSWNEMAFVKDLCWDDEDDVVQFHPRHSEYVNLHPHVLHLWRPIGIELPRPPSILVGPKR